MFEALLGFLSIFFEVLLQPLSLWSVPPLDSVGDTGEGLTCIVTGPTSGIGREIAAALARRKAHVVLACRSRERGERLQGQLQEEARRRGCPAPSTEVMLLDLASLQSVRAFAAAWEARRQPLHVLVNNAGIFSMGAQREETVDGAEAHLGTNHLGAFLLTLLLLPSLRAAAEQARSFGAGGCSSPRPSLARRWQGARPAGAQAVLHIGAHCLRCARRLPVRVVNVSSKMHELCPGFGFGDPHLQRPEAYSSSVAYAQSKFAQVAFTAELRRRLPPRWGVVAAAVHPGEVMTDVVRTLPLGLQRLYKLALRLLLLTPAQGARSAVFCATSRLPILAEHQASEAPNCYFGSDCKCAWPSAAALDPEAGGLLWHWSARAVGLPPGHALPPTGDAWPAGGPRASQAAGKGGDRALNGGHP